MNDISSSYSSGNHDSSAYWSSINDRQAAISYEVTEATSTSQGIVNNSPPSTSSYNTSAFDGLSLSNYVNYSRLTDLANDIVSNENAISNQLSNVSIAGGIENNAYYVDNSTEFNDSIDDNDSNLSNINSAIDADIEDTEKLINNISSQIAESNDQIKINNTKIAENDAQIAEYRAMMLETKTITDYDSNRNVTTTYQVPKYNNELLAKNITLLETFNSNIKEKNIALKSDNNNLELVLDKYEAKRNAKYETNRKIMDIYKSHEEANTNLEGIYTTINDDSILPENGIGISNNLAVQPRKLNFFDHLIGALSTGCVFVKAAANGTNKVLENIKDGAVWLATDITSSLVEFGTETIHFLGIHQLAENINVLNAAYRESQANWINIDQVGNANTYFYEQTRLGNAINEYSNLKYNSEPVQRFTDTAENFAQRRIEIALTLATGNPLMAAALGGVSEIGETAENSDNTAHILLNGVSGAAKGYMTGEVTNSINNIISNITNTGGLGNYARAMATDARDVLGQIRNRSIVENAANLGRQTIASIGNVDNAVQVVGTTAQLIDNTVQDGESFDYRTFFETVVTEYGMDAAFGYADNFKRVGEINFTDVLSAIDQYVDSTEGNIQNMG